MEAEHSSFCWLRARFALDYMVSSGEIIDVRRETPRASRFLLPNGMRLVPIESVAAVVEVKLTLTKEEFEKADIAATESLRHRVRHGAGIPESPDGHVRTPLATTDAEEGIGVNDPRLGHSRPTFSIFASGGVWEPETIAGWVKSAKTIKLVVASKLDASSDLRPRVRLRR